MIFQCPSCRVLADVSQVCIEEGRAGISCPECAKTHWLVAEAGPDAVEASGSPTVANSAGVSPPSVWPELQQDLAALPPPADGFAFLHDEFVALLAHWHDAAAHQALLQKAAAVSQLPALGMRYRLVLERKPDDPEAKRAQQQIVQLAFASLPMRSENAREGRLGLLFAAAGVGLFALGLCVWYWVWYGPGF